ncbi:hypothetical protein [Vulgatibacter sp.]|uniref:hypothetical protein n=1 Tax=Vulgatibacter sp. TaxID=1971226 RepID=UPI00356169C2
MIDRALAAIERSLAEGAIEEAEVLAAALADRCAALAAEGARLDDATRAAARAALGRCAAAALAQRDAIGPALAEVASTRRALGAYAR